jgi:hypothetical protein
LAGAELLEAPRVASIRPEAVESAAAEVVRVEDNVHRKDHRNVLPKDHRNVHPKDHRKAVEAAADRAEAVAAKAEVEVVKVADSAHRKDHRKVAAEAERDRLMAHRIMDRTDRRIMDRMDRRTTDQSLTHPDQSRIQEIRSTDFTQAIHMARPVADIGDGKTRAVGTEDGTRSSSAMTRTGRSGRTTSNQKPTTLPGCLIRVMRRRLSMNSIKTCSR